MRLKAVHKIDLGKKTAKSKNIVHMPNDEFEVDKEIGEDLVERGAAIKLPGSGMTRKEKAEAKKAREAAIAAREAEEAAQNNQGEEGAESESEETGESEANSEELV